MARLSLHRRVRDPEPVSEYYVFEERDSLDSIRGCHGEVAISTERRPACALPRNQCLHDFRRPDAAAVAVSTGHRRLEGYKRRLHGFSCVRLPVGPVHGQKSKEGAGIMI